MKPHDVADSIAAMRVESHIIQRGDQRDDAQDAIER